MFIQRGSPASCIPVLVVLPAEEAGLFLHVPPGVQHAAGTET